MKALPFLLSSLPWGLACSGHSLGECIPPSPLLSPSPRASGQVQPGILIRTLPVIWK